MLSLLVILILSYLVGSIPASVWVGKAFYGIDVRDHGSGNAGATNAFRVLGWKAGISSIVIDIGKGVFAAGVVASLRLDALPAGLEFWQVETVVRVLAGLAAIVGHMYPVWAGFRGGKGVATAAGVFLAITPVTMSIVLAIFAVVLLTTRYVSLASIIGATSFPATVAIRRYLFDVSGVDVSLLVIGILLAVGIIYAHRSNIQRLVEGRENRVRTFRPARGMLGRGELDPSSKTS